MNGPEAIDNIDKFVTAMSKISALAGIKAERKRIIELSSKRCGNCENWMKSRDCPQERNVNGFSRGPSTSSKLAISCSKYNRTQHSIDFENEKLSEIEAKLKALT